MKSYSCKFPSLWKQACFGILLCIAVALALELNKVGKATDIRRDELNHILMAYNGYEENEMPLSIDTKDHDDCIMKLTSLLFYKFTIKIVNEPESSHKPFAELCGRHGPLNIIISKKAGH